MAAHPATDQIQEYGLFIYLYIYIYIYIYRTCGLSET